MALGAATGAILTTRSSSGYSAAIHPLNPPSSGRTLWNPSFFICSATRALVSSLGQVQTRMNSFSTGNSLALASMSSGSTLMAPGMPRGSCNTSSG